MEMNPQLCARAGSAVLVANLLALDQSSRISGWAVFEDGGLVESGTFTFTDSNIGQRLVKIKNKVLQLIEDYNIDEVIFEDIQMQGGNVATFKALAEVFGVLNEVLEERKIPNSAVLAVVWKSKLGIKGARREEQKRNAQKFVENKYGLKVSQDESDAICIGTYKSQLQEDFNWD